MFANQNDARPAVQAELDGSRRAKTATGTEDNSYIDLCTQFYESRRVVGVYVRPSSVQPIITEDMEDKESHQFEHDVMTLTKIVESMLAEFNPIDKAILKENITRILIRNRYKNDVYDRIESLSKEL